MAIANKYIEDIRHELKKEGVELDVDQTEEDTILAFGGVLAGVAHADEVIKKVETNYLYEIISKYELVPNSKVKTCTEIILKYEPSIIDIIDMCDKLCYKYNIMERKTYLELAVELANSDNHFDEREISLCKKIAKFMKIPKEQSSAIIK